MNGESAASFAHLLRSASGRIPRNKILNLPPLQRSSASHPVPPRSTVGGHFLGGVPRNADPRCFCGGRRSFATDHSKDRALANENENDERVIPLVPPPPAWSVHDLRLAPPGRDDGGDESISEEELSVLARRCLVDVDQFSDDQRRQLRADVAGIMRCASVLLDAEEQSVCRLTDEEVYDAPRGLGRMPLRRDIITAEDDADDWERYACEESRAVMQSDAVRCKMTEVNGEMYFSVDTSSKRGRGL